MVIVGIDLGVTGAMCGIDSRGTSALHDLPITVEEAAKRLDARGFVELVRYLIPANDCGALAMEDVHVMAVRGRQMSHSTETTLVGLRFGAQALADMLRIKVHLVRPQEWKRHYGIKADTKGNQAREIAARLYPTLAPQLALVKDHNRADSVLIAHYVKGLVA